MGSDLEASVGNIFRHLARMGRPIAGRLRPGASKAELAAAGQAMNVSLHPDFLELYSIADATETIENEKIGDAVLFPGYYWMRLNEVSEQYIAMAGDQRWSSTWAPFFATGGGDFYAVQCNESSSQYGNVIGFMIGEAEQFVEFRDIRSMLAVLSSSFDEGAFFESSGYLEADYPKMRSIARRIQAGFEESIAMP